MYSWFWCLLLPLVLLFLCAGSPLSMVCILVGVTLVLALGSAQVFSYAWVSYMLVLILLGALLVSFLYICLVASNDQLALSRHYWVWLLTLPLLWGWSGYGFKVDTETLLTLLKLEDTDWLAALYSMELSWLTIFLVVYLFLTLLVVVANSSSLRITLRAVLH